MEGSPHLEVRTKNLPRFGRVYRGVVTDGYKEDDFFAIHIHWDAMGADGQAKYDERGLLVNALLHANADYQEGIAEAEYHSWEKPQPSPFTLEEIFERYPGPSE